MGAFPSFLPALSPTVSAVTDFSDWLARKAHDRGIDTEAELSRAVKTSQSIVGRWRIQGSIPEISTLRRISDGLNIPIQEVLVAAQYVYPEEVGVIEVNNTTLRDFTYRELLDELERRLRVADET
ncbi:transcriptional regulator with XRE-family HTH domain [Prescottella agglutinans]|uniref:Transcriptional regulator with XRE-family HTH domain n=1 Tax=Prescottella agglutinans TaxID=1644129 RepID=A0ABT6MG66_9NOCA|nr:transcriptional regulator with XRE-family HTH domain [Prescottella agglutinans]